MVDGYVERFDLRKCISCGRCSYSCPISIREGDFSPRTFCEHLIQKGEVSRENAIWSCMSCAACTETCDSGVKFHELMREVRKGVRDEFRPELTHGGLMELIREINAQEWISPSKNGWLTGDLRTDPSSPTLLFVGCIPYFDVIFEEFTGNLLEIPRAAVKLLNAMDIIPRLLPEERCCGHDSYWLGDEKNFLNLAKINTKLIKNAGVKRVVTICPEGYFMLKCIYPRYLGSLGFEVVSILELVDHAVSSGRMRFSPMKEIITFQDPCRLTRYMKLGDVPRRLLRTLGEFREMERSGRVSACCGHSHWVNCDSYTRRWQLERLTEAKETGATILATACPKCLIHFSCTQRGPDVKERIAVRDILSLLASRIRTP